MAHFVGHGCTPCCSFKYDIAHECNNCFYSLFQNMSHEKNAIMNMFKPQQFIPYLGCLMLSHMLKQTWAQNFTIITFVNFQPHGLELNALIAFPKITVGLLFLVFAYIYTIVCVKPENDVLWLSLYLRRIEIHVMLSGAWVTRTWIYILLQPRKPRYCIPILFI